MKKLIIAALFSWFFVPNVHGAAIIATVGNQAITDADITARTRLMSRQGNISTDNRKQALQSIIDDHIKLEYAANFKALPSDADVNKEISAMNLGDMSATERAMAKSAVTANIAWQMVIGRTIIPTVDVSSDDVLQEKRDLERARGLPIEMTIVRLVDIPADIAAKLTKPKTCDDAVSMAEKMGGSPQRFTALQYELSEDIRERVVGLAKLTWSTRKDDSVLLVCSEKKTQEYGKLDDIVKQNTVYKKALFMADQQLKQLRRKAIIVINDPKYKI